MSSLIKIKVCFLFTILSYSLRILAQTPENIEVYRDSFWRLDNVESYRDNGFRGEVILNGFWIHDIDTQSNSVFVPGGMTELRDGTQKFWREFTVPHSWINRKLTLEIATTHEAEVFIDGIKLENFIPRKRFLEIEIPSKSGRRKLLVITSGKITDDVWLRSYPSGEESIKESYIITSFRNKLATVQLSGVSSSGSVLKVNLTISEKADGEIVRNISKDIKANSDGQWATELSEEWLDAKLWSRWHPYLYYYQAQLLDNKGNIIDKILPRRFGFCEVWIENGKFMINGIPTTFAGDTWHNYSEPNGNPNRQRLEREIYSLKKLGLTHGSFKSELGQNVADELGLIGNKGIGSIVRLNVWDPSSGFTPMNGKEEMDDIIRLVKRFREHPSILFWSSSAPYSQISMHPEFTGRKTETWRYFPLNRASIPSMEALYVFKEMKDIIVQIDPARTVTCNQGPFTEIDLTTRYLTNNLDIQEREEFFDDWYNANERQAILVSEWGSPFSAEYFLRHIDFVLHQTKSPLGIHTPKIYVESAARQFGEQVYLSENDEQIASWCKTDGRLIRGSSVFQKLISENVIYGSRSLRTYGINYLGHHILTEDIFSPIKTITDPAARDGFTELAEPRVMGSAFIRGTGWVTDEFDEPWTSYSDFHKVHQPLYAYIGGADRFVTKDHLFFSGNRVRKSAVIINDYDEPVYLEGNWSVVSAKGDEILSGKLSGEVKAGERELKHLLIEFTAPEVTKRTDFTITLKLTANLPGTLEDTFNITVFPESRQDLPPFSGNTWILNISDQLTHETQHPIINRENEEFIKAIGLDCKLISGLKTFSFKGTNPSAAAAWHKERALVSEGNPEPGDLLIIPRHTLIAGYDESQLNLRLLEKMGLDSLIEQGLRVIIFEQDLPNVFGIQTEEVRPRRAFISAPGHPVFEGLTDSDLSYWSGNSDLQTAITPIATSDARFPERMWHVSNTNAVASVTYIRPQVGAVRALAVSGFDLGESPLLEVTRGKGRILFCQFDVTNRYNKDPAATILVNNLIRYLLTAEPPDPSKSQIELLKGKAVTYKHNLYRADKPKGSDGWGITYGELFFRESVYKDIFSPEPSNDVPVLVSTANDPFPQIIRKTSKGTYQLCLDESRIKTGWDKRKIKWIYSALIVNQGGSLNEGPALRHHGRITDLYPVSWIEGFVHPYNSNIW